MAYRRRQGITRASTFKEEIYRPTMTPSSHSQFDNEVENENENSENENGNGNGNGGSSSLAARAIRASAAHRDSSAYASAYASSDSSSSSSSSPSTFPASSSSHRDPAYFRSFSLSNKGWYKSDDTPMDDKDPGDSKYGFWGILANKAKSILQEDDFESSSRVRSPVNYPTSGSPLYQSHQSSEGGTRLDNTKLRKRLDAITSSLNHLGDTIGNAFEEGRTIVEHKTADIIQETRNKTADILQETRKIQIRRRGGNLNSPDQATVLQNTSWQRPVIQPVQTHALANQETQLKASRDVAMATAAKAKVLLRELKTVKADLAFAKERCGQLEEENKRFRESREKGDNPADDDLIRLQLETLLAEKARLAHENSIYARENRFLREIVEYHQLTMQDIVYLDEGAEEVTEVYPFSMEDAKVLSSTPTSPSSPTLLPEVSSLGLPLEMKEHPVEAPKDLFNPTSQSSSSSLPEVSLPSCPLQKEESLPATSSEKVEAEHSHTSTSRTPNSVGEDPERPSILSS